MVPVTVNKMRTFVRPIDRLFVLWYNPKNSIYSKSIAVFERITSTVTEEIEQSGTFDRTGKDNTGNRPGQDPAGSGGEEHPGI